MNISRLLVLMAVATLCAGCAARSGRLESREQTTYYDRNGDGAADLEKHHYPGVADADWELRDDDFDGRYEKKVVFGVGVIESVVNLPVPKHVRIEPKP